MTFCSGGKRLPCKSCVFSAYASAQSAEFGALGVIWVGIWVGETELTRSADFPRFS